MAAKIGDALSSVPTPALVLDLAALERNVAAMQASLAPHAPRVRLRPHGKAFKSSALTGFLNFERLCCQTVREAEVLVAGGCTDVLLTNQVVGEAKLRRLASLARGGARVGALVDDASHVSALQRAAADGGCSLTAYVEIDAGQQRCGVAAASDEALALARSIVDAPSLVFGGLQVYHGGIQHLRSAAERRRAVLEGPVARARATVERLAAAGISCDVVSGGGTGTYLWEVEGGAHTELQPGSFLFMDGDYAQNENGGGSAVFEPSLFVRATVISCSGGDGGRRVIDAGSKAIDLLCGAPTLAPSSAAELGDGVTYVLGGDEHGILLNVPPGMLPVGSAVQLVPSHCDPAVNLHSAFIGVRDGVCEHVFPIDARGSW